MILYGKSSSCEDGILLLVLLESSSDSTCCLNEEYPVRRQEAMILLISVLTGSSAESVNKLIMVDKTLAVCSVPFSILKLGTRERSCVVLVPVNLSTLLYIEFRKDKSYEFLHEPFMRTLIRLNPIY